MPKAGPAPKLEILAVGGWKDGYFADRGPRLMCRLIHPPSNASSVPITVRTQTKDNVSSAPLVVKQELQGNSMKNWQHVFTILAVDSKTGKPTELLVKAKTRKNMDEWLAALNSHKREARRISGALWLKPNEERRHFTLSDTTLSMSKAETTPVVATWTIKASKNADDEGYAKHVEKTLTLLAENRWQTTVVFGFQLGFFMNHQQFVATAPSEFGIKPVRTQWFEVKSSNRHTNRDNGRDRKAKGRGAGRTARTTGGGTGRGNGAAGRRGAPPDPPIGSQASPTAVGKRGRSKMAGRRNRPPNAAAWSNDAPRKSAQVAAGIRERHRQRGAPSIASLAGGSESSNSLGTIGTSGSAAEMLLEKKTRTISNNSDTDIMSQGYPSLLADELRDVHLGYSSTTSQAFKLEMSRTGGEAAVKALQLRPEDRDGGSDERFFNVRQSMRSLLAGHGGGSSGSLLRGVMDDDDASNDGGILFPRSREVSADTTFNVLSVGSLNSLDSWRSQQSEIEQPSTQRELSTGSQSAAAAAVAAAATSTSPSPPAPSNTGTPSALRLTPASLSSLRTYLGDLCQTMQNVTEFETGVTLATLTEVHGEAFRLVQQIATLRVQLAQSQGLPIPPQFLQTLPAQQSLGVGAGSQQPHIQANRPPATRVRASSHSDQQSQSSQSSRRHYIRHRVQPSDTVGGLCLKYGVEASALKAVNGYTKDHIWTKEYLLIPQPQPAQSVDGSAHNQQAGHLVCIFCVFDALRRFELRRP